ncbi:hypothetical protein BM221_000460 [Beauveria bassiana]|uniref:Uncharacterized protein n=1 Tax=Beauveria bassiana TaxID=176275 RepID=A0A2N6P0J9_BEABA|nr:hypothetical protein BM221_000460 [Beauveria bassiana]
MISGGAARSSPDKVADLQELNEFVGPIVGSWIASSGNKRLANTSLEARAFDGTEDAHLDCYYESR